MPVTEQDALRAMGAFKELSGQPELQAKAKLIHDTYRSEQEAAGKPLFEGLKREQAQQQLKVRKLFQDREKHGLPDDARASIDETFRENPDEKYALFNRKFFETSGIPKEQVDSLGDALIKDYSKRTWGEEVADNKAFSERLGADFDTEDSARKMAQVSAMNGVDMFEGLAKLEEENANNPNFKARSKHWQDLYRKDFEQAESQFSPYRQIIDETANALRETKGLSSGPQMDGVSEREDTASYEEIANDLLSVPDSDRGLVIQAIIQKSQNEGDEEKLDEKKIIERFGRGVGGWIRGTTASAQRREIANVRRIVDSDKGVPAEWLKDSASFFKGLESVKMLDPVFVANSTAQSGNSLYPIPDDLREEISAELDRGVKQVDLVREIAGIANNEIDPATSESLMMRGLLGAAESIPYTLVAMAPAGMLANIDALTETAHEQLSRSNPDLTESQKNQVSAIAGPVSAALELIPASYLKGTFPTLGRWMNKAIATGPGLAGRMALRSAEQLGAELITENSQDLSPFAVQGLIGALSEGMPDVDVKSILKDTLDQQPELIATIIPLLIFGAASGTSNDFKEARKLIASPDYVASLTGDTATATIISDLGKAGKYKEAQTLLNSELRRSGHDTKEIQETRIAAAQNLQREAIAQKEAIEKGEELGIIPIVTPKTNVKIGEDTFETAYLVRFNDNTERLFPTYTEATEAKWAHAGSKNLRFHEDLIATIDFSDRSQQEGKGTRFIITGQDENVLKQTDSGKTDRGYALNRANIAVKVDGQTLPSVDLTDEQIKALNEDEYGTGFTAAQMMALNEDDRLAAMIILGENTSKWENGIYVTTAKIHNGATWATVIEEKAEGDAQFIIEDGRGDWLYSSLRAWEKASGFDIFRDNIEDGKQTRGDIKEAYSRMVVSYFAGRWEDGENSFQRSKRFRKQYKAWYEAGLSGSMEGYARFFAGVAQRADSLQQMRKKGVLDPELERELARSTGYGEQAQYEDSVFEEAQGQAEELKAAGFVESQAPAYSEMSGQSGTLDDAPYSVLSNAQDTEYLNLAKDPEANREKLQAMVDEAARAAGYDIGPVWHFTNANFDTFNPGERRMVYFNEREDAARAAQLGGTKRAVRAFLRASDPFNSKANPIYHGDAEANFIGKIPHAQSHVISAAQSFIEYGDNPTVETLSDIYPEESPEDIEASIRVAKGEKVQRREVKTVFETTGTDLAYVSDEGGISIAVPNPNQIKSADPVTYDESGNVIPLSQRFDPARDEISYSVLSNAQDTEYLNLAKDPEANREKLQAMVDEAVEQLTESVTGDQTDYWHYGIRTEDGEYKVGDVIEGESVHWEDGVPTEDGLGGLSSTVIGSSENGVKSAWRIHREWNYSGDFSYVLGADDAASNDMGDEGEILLTKPKVLAVIEDHEKPVTYDESGNVIPLSQRFNPARDEISYSVLSNVDQKIAEIFTPYLRDPEQRFRIVQEVQKRSVEKGREWQPILNANRTNAEIEAERKTVENDLIGQKLETLSPSELGALEAQGALDDVGMRPILSDLLREKFYKSKSGKSVRYWTGSLMSKSAAAREGIDTKGGEWDGIPEGLPPYVWGGSITPDQAATQFGFDTQGEFWNAIQAEISSFQNLKEDTQKAMARIREIEKEAKAESKVWADEQKKIRRTVGSDRATLIGAMRTLDAMISALPVEIRGKIGGFVKLAQYTSPQAMLNELERRSKTLDRELERWMKKEADRGVKKLFDKAKPAVDQAGKKRVGKAGAEIHDLFDTARKAWKNWDSEKAEAHAVGLEAEIGKGEMSGRVEAFALMEVELVRSFGGWREADSIRRVHALETATALWAGGFLEYQQQKAEEKELRDKIRKELIGDTGKTGALSERNLAEEAGLTFGAKSKEFMLGLLNFDQLVSYAFGKKSKWAKWFAENQRNAENQKLDAVQEVTEGVEDLFTMLAGGKRFDGERLQFKLSRKSITAKSATGDNVRLSELEGLTVLLMWQQEDGKRHMRGRKDEDGNLSSSWSYDDNFVDEVSGQLSREAWGILGYLQGEYSQEYGPLNEVYRKLYGVNLPKNPNYSPLTMAPQQASGGQSVDPVTGTTASNGSMTPGGLRTRGAGAIAEPQFRDAVATFIAHRKQMEHWKAHAEFNRDAQAILGNRELGNSLEAKHGREAVTVLRKWLDAIAQGGVRDVAADTRFTRGLANMMGNAAGMALVGRAGTIAVQATQLGAAAAKMPAGAYAIRLGKLLSGNLEWGAALNSPYIQRRLKQQPIIVQAAMEGLRAGKPTQLKHQVRKLGNLIGGADALFTAGTFAMVQDYQYSQAIQNGASPAEAAEISLTEAERITDEVAQPTRLGARSYTEVSMTNPLAKLSWAFGSEARKNLALLAYNVATGTAAEKAQAILYVVAINGLLSGVIRNAWRDARGDDDDEVFDERYWSAKRLGLVTATDWLFGFPVVGEQIQNAIFSAFGEYQFDSSLLDPIGKAPGSVKKLVTGDSKDVLRDVENIMTAIGLFDDNTAAATSIMHMIRDLYGLGKNFTD